MSYDNIVHLWFQSVDPEKLNEVEQTLIHNAESDGLLLTNVVHVSNISGESNLDEIISPAQQEEWLESDSKIPNDGKDFYDEVAEKFKIRNRKQFETLKEEKDYPIIKRILHTYIHKSNAFLLLKKQRNSFGHCPVCREQIKIAFHDIFV
jgi:hypothetical protein